MSTKEELLAKVPRTFDYALPLAWYEAVHSETGIWPQTLGFVWGYPDSGKGHIYGLPYPITPEAEALYNTLPESLR